MTKKKQEIAIVKNDEIVSFTNEQIDLISRTIAVDATRDELALFIGACKRTGLDPFTRQIYFIKGKDGRVIIMSSVDGFRVVAVRSGEYAGQDAPVWEEQNGHIIKCTVTAYRWHGEQRFPAGVGVAYFNEYNKPGRNGYESNWDKMPHTMISKVAECIALRKAFPNDLSGLYATEEMDQASNGESIAPTPNAPRNYYCDRCISEKGGKKATPITAEQAAATKAELGYELCAPCAELGRKAKATATKQPEIIDGEISKADLDEALSAPPKTVEAKAAQNTDALKEYQPIIDGCVRLSEIDELRATINADLRLSAILIRTLNRACDERLRGINAGI